MSATSVLRAPEKPQSPRRGRPGLTLASVSFGLFMVGLDGTVVSIANPAIASSLGTSFAELQWITNAYLLGLAVFLILGGKLGDRFGRRRMYLIGVAVFAVTSVAIGLVGSAEGVIAFRALQGIGAALLMPQTLALLRSTFPKEKFGMAVGIWGGVSSVAIAAGPIVGGALVALFGWESVFYINAPIAVIGLLFGGAVLAESKAPTHGQFDLVGVVLLALGLFGIVLGIVQSQSWGWMSPLTLCAITLGLVLLGVFVVVENRVENPLLPMTLFRNPTLSVGAIAIGVNFFALFGATFFLPLFLLNLRGVSGVEAGLLMLPLSGVSIIASPIGALLVATWGIRPTMATGLGLIAVAMFGLTFISATSPYVAMAVPFVLLALGVGMVMTSGAEAIVGSAPVRLAGVAGGLQATSLQLGGALGTSVFAAIVSATALAGTAGLDMPESAREGVAQGLVPAEVSATVARAAQDAFLGGLHTAFLTAAIVAAIAGVLAAIVVRSHTART